MQILPLQACTARPRFSGAFKNWKAIVLRRFIKKLKTGFIHKVESLLFRTYYPRRSCFVLFTRFKVRKLYSAYFGDEKTFSE